MIPLLCTILLLLLLWLLYTILEIITIDSSTTTPHPLTNSRPRTKAKYRYIVAVINSPHAVLVVEEDKYEGGEEHDSSLNDTAVSVVVPVFSYFCFLSARWCCCRWSVPHRVSSISFCSSCCSFIAPPSPPPPPPPPPPPS